MTESTKKISKVLEVLMKELDKVGEAERKSAYALLLERMVKDARGTLREEIEMDLEKSFSRCR